MSNLNRPLQSLEELQAYKTTLNEIAKKQRLLVEKDVDYLGANIGKIVVQSLPMDDFIRNIPIVGSIYAKYNSRNYRAEIKKMTKSDDASTLGVKKTDKSQSSQYLRVLFDILRPILATVAMAKGRQLLMKGAKKLFRC